MVLSVKQITEAEEKAFTSSLNISPKEKWTEGRGVMPPLLTTTLFPSYSGICKQSMGARIVFDPFCDKLETFFFDFLPNL